jgi:hypothetical protein
MCNPCLAFCSTSRIANAGLAHARERLEQFAAHQRREAERGLVQQQQSRRRHQRAADRDHLLLAAAHGAGDLRAALGKAREQRATRARLSLSVARARRAKAPSSRFSRTVSSGKMPRPSGTSAMPASTISCGGSASRSLPSNVTRARLRLDSPAIALSKRRLAGAVRTEHHDDLARLDVEVDAGSA